MMRMRIRPMRAADAGAVAALTSQLGYAVTPEETAARLDSDRGAARARRLCGVLGRGRGRLGAHPRIL